MDSLWIVHDEAPVRAAIARLAGVAPRFSGTIAEAGASGEVAPDAVILGVPRRSDEALAAASRIAAAHPDARWVLLRPPGARPGELERRFAVIAPTLLSWPPPAAALRRALAEPARTAAASSLASHRQREALVRRFTRSFGDLDLANPIGNGGPLFVVGESGTGRLLLARVVHALAERPSAFLHFACEAGSDLPDLARRLEEQDGQAITICLEHPESLPASIQRELRGWVELGPPNAGIDPSLLRWIALIDETAVDLLDPELERALSGFEIRIPPLRERAGAAERFAEGWLAEWCHVRGLADRPLAADACAALAADAWPGNLRDLEETLRRAVASGGTGPVTAALLGMPADAPDSPEPRSEPLALEPAEGRIAPEPSARPSDSPMAFASDADARRDVDAERAARDAVPSFARALSHELRNPMVSLRTFAQLLPERHDDPTFRDEFRYQVESDLARMDAQLTRLHAFGELRHAEAKPVDISALVEELLDRRRGAIADRSLLVLRELEDERPEALGDADRLRFAFEALLDAAFDAVSDGADLYVACRHHPRGLDERSAMRVLVRFHTEHAPLALPGERGELELALLLARRTLEDLGGRLSVDSTEADERVLLIDLPAPERLAP